MKLSDCYPNHSKDLFDGHDITNFSVYANDSDDNEQDKVGSVTSVLVDETDGSFRYFIVDTGFWVFGKKVLLPVGLARLNYDKERLYVAGLTKDQVENLPEFNDDLKIDNDYEERVRSIYRPSISSAAVTQPLLGVGYSYQQEPYFYQQNDLRFRSYEQQLRDRNSPQTSRF
ncbi:PRC-barrel domain-containing protein [Microcoleus sp. FACHB-1515]|uniref:PRC-barrel domain-containing protein n=1 Tax=Cyanophyceae TaxID=3028117 RepID=UPI001A7ECFB9|nr:PRC-barrel domain-containing protein [Microcoleus sp. FACHB-1515]